VILVVFVALAGAVVMAAWAGARRTASAYTRLSDATNHADLLVATQDDPARFDPAVAVEGPGVAKAGIVEGFAGVEMKPDGTLDFESSTGNGLLVPVTPTAWYDLDRALLEEGRYPALDAADEIIIPEAMRDVGYPLGTVVDMCLVDLAEAFSYGQGVLEGTASAEEVQGFVDDVCTVHHLRVVGITHPGPDEVVIRADTESDVFIQGSPALLPVAGAPSVFSFVLVDLAPDADIEAYVDAVLERTPPDAGVSISMASMRAAVVERTVEPYVRALTLFAAAAAIAACGVLAPLIVRWAGTAEVDRGTLRALGVGPSEMRVAGALRGGAFGLVAAVGGVAAAFLASSRFPIGIARPIDPDPGRRADLMVLAIGAVVMVVLCAVLGAVGGTRRTAPITRHSRIAELLQRSGGSPATLTGVRAALTGEGGAAGTFRTIGGVAIAIAAITTALSYEAGLSRLLDSPSRYGWTWDTLIQADADLTPLIDTLKTSESVAGMTVGYRTPMFHDGLEIQAFAFSRASGSTYPTIVDGRAPEGESEIALGGQTLDRLGVELGDELAVRSPNGTSFELTVVGQTLLPFLSLSQDLSVAEGGLISDALLPRFGAVPASLAAIDLASGATPADIQAILDNAESTLVEGYDLLGPTYTADLRGYDAVRRTPLLLAAALGLLGVGVLAHTIATSVRRRRRELAVLSCLGFSRRNLRATVYWHVITLVVVSLLVAVPVGVVVGRSLWTGFAHGIGLAGDAVTPWPALVVVVAVTVSAALLLAALPGRQAGRIQPATVLRTE
jgi:FtsX-like permease family